MTTQLPALGTSTPNGFQPARGTVIDPNNPAASRPQPGAPSAPTAPSATSTGLKPAPSGTSTPGTGATVAAPDTSALGQDPAYLAYLRALGVKDTTESAAIQNEIDAQNRNLALRLPQYQQQFNQQDHNLLGRMEARGILNSGETENNMANLGSAQQQRQAALQDAGASRINSLLQQLAEFRANQGVGAAEQGIKAGQTVANANGNTQLSTDLANASASL